MVLIAADDANMARCGKSVTCRQTNDDSDTSVNDKYIAAAILERQDNNELNDANHTRYSDNRISLLSRTYTF